MQESEQVLSVIAVTSVFENDTLVAAGGYLVQTLPELSEAMLAIMTERLTHLAPIGELLRDARTSPDSLLDELLHAMPYARLADTPLHFACRCDVVRIMASLATLQRSDIQEMVNDAKPLEIRCDYCQKDYRIETEQLRGLLAES
jgi:molecular chaperone Hsp33